MGYNYKMHGKDPQQQAIVRQREKEEETRRRETEKHNRVSWKAILPNGPYHAVEFFRGVQKIAELRISNVAVNNQTCGLNVTEAHEWLGAIGAQRVKEMKSFEIIFITANDVRDGKLVTSWLNLNRVEE